MRIIIILNKIRSKGQRSRQNIARISCPDSGQNYSPRVNPTRKRQFGKNKKRTLFSYRAISPRTATSINIHPEPVMPGNLGRFLPQNLLVAVVLTTPNKNVIYATKFKQKHPTETTQRTNQ